MTSYICRVVYQRCIVDNHRIFVELFTKDVSLIHIVYLSLMTSYVCRVVYRRRIVDKHRIFVELCTNDVSLINIVVLHNCYDLYYRFLLLLTCSCSCS
jgi:hypothetical protein